MSAQAGDRRDQAKLRQLSGLLATLTLLSPLLIGGVPAWSLVICAALSLCGLGLVLLSGAYLRSLRLLMFSGSLLSVAGALISLIPLSTQTVKASGSGVMTIWAQLAELAAGEGAMSPSWTLSVTPVETLGWVALELCCLTVAYLALHLHRERRVSLIGLASVGPLLTILGLAHAGLGLDKIYGLYQSVDREALRGFYTPMINQNSAASLMLLSALSALGVGLHQLSREEREGLGSREHRWWLSAACVSSFGVALCSSRAALLALIIGLISLVWTARAQLKLRPLYVGLGALALLLSLRAVEWGSLMSLMSWGAERGEGSFLSERHPYPRLLVWRDCLSYLQQHWLWGSGRGSFGEVYMSFQSFSARMWISHPESHPLQQLSEGGLLGFIGGVSLPLIAWWTWLRRSMGRAHLSALGLWVALGAVCAHQLADFGFERAGLSLPVAVAWGLLWSYLPARDEQRERLLRERSRARRAFMLITLGVGLASSIALYYASAREGLKLRDVALKERSSELKPDRVSVSALSLHPASAHIAQELLLQRARLWLSSSARPLSEEEAASLRRWLRFVKLRGPQQSVPFQVEGRLLRLEGLGELAGLSYRAALARAPWRFRELSDELLKGGLVRPDYVPSRSRAAFMRRVYEQLGSLAFVRLSLAREGWRRRLTGLESHQDQEGASSVAQQRAVILKACATQRARLEGSEGCLTLLSEMQRGAAETLEQLGLEHREALELDYLSAYCLARSYISGRGDAPEPSPAAEALKRVKLLKAGLSPQQSPKWRRRVERWGLQRCAAL